MPSCRIGSCEPARCLSVSMHQPGRGPGGGTMKISKDLAPGVGRERAPLLTPPPTAGRPGAYIYTAQLHKLPAALGHWPGHSARKRNTTAAGYGAWYESSNLHNIMVQDNLIESQPNAWETQSRFSFSRNSPWLSPKSSSLPKQLGQLLPYMR